MVLSSLPGKTVLRAGVLMMLIILFQVFSKSQQVYATHAAGSDLTYRSLGGNQYELEVSFYRDCAGIDAPPVITVFYRSVSCGYNLNVTVSQVPNSEIEISVPCSTSATTCNNGLTTGIKKFVYRAVVSLPAACSDWVFSYSICCRNCSITTIDDPCGSNSNLYVEAKLNNLTAPGNSSPAFTNNPIAFVCVGQNFNFNQGVFDADGDSLSYSLITPKTSANTIVQFLPPATTSTPIASSTPFSINAVTGDINFTPSQIQIGVLAVLVQEFRNGQLIGSVIRDIQIYATACFNNLPTVSGINGTNNYTATVCPGQQICFDIFTDDSDLNQVVTMSTNNGIPGGSFTVSGGNNPVGTFCWTPGYNDVDLLPKTFTVTVTDDNCPTKGQQTFSFSIFVPSPFFNFTTTPVTCNNGSDGSATASSVYGNVYNYSWNTVPVQNSANATGLSAGTYILTVSDTNSCSLSVPVLITQPDPLNVSANVTPVSCSGICNGSIDLTLSGGTPGYSVLWNDGVVTEDRTGLCDGVYAVTVTDFNGCSSVQQYTLQNSQSISAIIDGLDVSCYAGHDGVADLLVTGGVQPLAYLWSDGQTTEDIAGLSPGVYSVVIVDANFCSTVSSVTIGEPDSISISSVVADITCFGSNDGLIDISVSGGTGTYSFSWTNNSSNEDLSNLSAGIYSVLIQDAYNCSASAIFSINEPDPVQLSFVSISSSCFGVSNGSVDITVTGGNSPYSYLWSNGSTNEDLVSVNSGTYSVSVTDSKQCELISAFAVTQPDSLEISFVTSNAICTSGSGTAEAIVSGGTPGFSYIWSNGQTTSLTGNLLPGLYTVTVTDLNLCQVIDTVTVGGSFENISLAFTTVSTNCSNSSDGSIDLNVSGGVEPYAYLWSDGSIAEDLLLVSGGNYTVIVTDVNGCTQTGAASIVSPDPLLGTVNVIQLSCNVTKGSIDLEVTGGTMPYTYSWSSGETTQDLTNLDPGFFTVTYTDLNGCSATLTVEVIQIDDLILTAETGNVSSQGGSDGTVDLTVTGGVEPYTFLWSDGNITEDLNNLSSGFYTVTVTDAAGCSSSLTVEIYENVSTSINQNQDEMHIQLIENGNGFYILGLTPGNTGKYKVQLYDQSGRIVAGLFDGDLVAFETQNITIQNNSLAGGIYLLQVNSLNCKKTMKLFIRNP